MKAKTQIEKSVKACYDAYADYARKVDNIPVIPNFPKVAWVRGSLKNPNTGWVIDGKLYPGSAEDVITYWDKLAARWQARMWKKLGVQLPLPDGDDGSTEAQPS